MTVEELIKQRPSMLKMDVEFKYGGCARLDETQAPETVMIEIHLKSCPKSFVDHTKGPTWPVPCSDENVPLV